MNKLLFLILVLLTSLASAEVNVVDFGADPTGKTDSLPAFKKAIDAESHNVNRWDVSTGRINVPAGSYKMVGELSLKKTVTLIGEGSGSPGGKATILEWYNGKSNGIVIHSAQTLGDGLDPEYPPSVSAAGTLIQGISLRNYGNGETGHGIWARAPVTLRDIDVRGWPENGVQLTGSLNSPIPSQEGGTSVSLLESVHVYGCGGHGFYCDGADSSASTTVNLSTISNKGWGIYDSSFLGNTHIGPHSASNVFGGYKTDSPTGDCTIIGGYCEIDQPENEFSQNTTIIGGQMVNSKGGMMIIGQWIKGKMYYKSLTDDSRNLEFSIRPYANSFMRVLIDGSNSTEMFGWDETWKAVVIGRQYNSSGYTPIVLFGERTTEKAGRSKPVASPNIMFPHGTFSGWVYPRHQTYDIAAPTTGEHGQGDIVWNAKPVDADSPLGWRCIESGTPGTWIDF